MSKSKVWSRHGRWAAAIALGLASVVALGTTATTASATSKAQQKELAALQKTLTALSQTKVPEPAPTTPVVPGTHQVAVISVGQSTPGASNTALAVQAAIKAIGWTAPATYDGQFSASVASGDMETAINNGAQALILISLTPSTVASALQLAASKGVAITCILCGPPSTYSQFPGIVGIEPSPAAIGDAQADWVIVNSKGTAKVWVYEDREFAETIAQTTAAENTIRTKCPGCQLHIAQTQAGDEDQPGIPVLAGVLSANPKGTINDIIAPYDGAAANFATFANQDGRPEINFVGYAGLPDFFDEIAEGVPPGAKADVSIPLPYMGWAAIDETARILDNQPTWNANNLGVSLITRQNVNKFNAANPYVNPTFNFKSLFLKLWGK